MTSPADWYNSLPVITKAWGTACFATTVGYHLGLVNPLAIYLDPDLVIKSFQIWRLLTCFFYVGPFSMKFLFTLLMLLRHGVQLESNTYRGRAADFLYMLLFGMVCMVTCRMLLGSLIRLPFLAGSLIFMVLYLWSREFPNANVSIMGIFTLQAFFLPWAYLGIDMMIGASILEDLLGIFIGHLYFFLTTIYPAQGGRELLKTPAFMHNLVSSWGIGDSAPQSFRGSAPAFTASSSSEGRPSTTQPTAPAAAPQSSAFRGRAYRLDRD